jgi:hypothetical protein
MIVVAILIGSLGGFADLASGGVNALIRQLGLSSLSGNIFGAYRAAIAQKFGSNSQTARQSSSSVTQSANPAFATSEGDASGGFSMAQPTGIKLTRYGYQGDPTGDTNSLKGIGAFSFDSQPGSLVPLQSAALSPDVVQAYNLHAGQQFTVQTAQGSMDLVYADNTAPNLSGRVDVYDPYGQLSNDGAAVTSISGGSISSTAQGGLFGLGSRIMDSVWMGLLWPLVHLLNLAALAIFWLMSLVQKILYYIEIAVSPIFLGMLLIGPLVPIATRFFCSLVALTLWPLAWAVADLVTRLLMDWAVNPSNNIAVSMFNGTGVELGIFVVLAIWVIGSAIFAPWFISKAIMGGASGISIVAGATLGAAAMRAQQMGYRAVTAGLSGALGSGGSAIRAPISPASASLMDSRQNFATRPMASPVSPSNGEKE